MKLRLRRWRPPTFAEFDEIAGHVFRTRDAPLGDVEAYQLVCSAVRLHDYDRYEALARLRRIAADHAAREADLARFRQAIEERSAAQPPEAAP